MKVVQIIGFLWSFSKNEEPNTISCINSVKNWGNRIIDLGSTANTTEIVKTLDADLAYVYIEGKKDYIPVYLSYNKELVEEVLK